MNSAGSFRTEFRYSGEFPMRQLIIEIWRLIVSWWQCDRIRPWKFLNQPNEYSSYKHAVRPREPNLYNSLACASCLYEFV